MAWLVDDVGRQPAGALSPPQCLHDTWKQLFRDRTDDSPGKMQRQDVQGACMHNC